MPAQHYNFTLDKAAIEALSEKDKVRLICAFMSNEAGYQFNWTAAAQRYGCQANSMSVLTGPVLKRLKIDGTANTAGNGATSTPTSKQAGGRGSGSTRTKSGGGGRKRKPSDKDSEELETPTKKAKVSSKAKSEKDSNTHGDATDSMFGEGGEFGGAYGINLADYEGMNANGEYDF